MSTNFYHVLPNGKTNHIGLSAHGWKFMWCGLKHKSVDEWKEAFKVGKIMDEYDREMTVEDFLNYTLNLCTGIQSLRRDKKRWVDDAGEIFYKEAFS